jgi:dihydrodipicolinate synthase/N-acetylneuraminate lyase
MKTTPVTPADLAASVLAVPPLARKPDLSLNHDANRALIRHIEAGGVSTLMYGGNANLYNVGLYEYAALLDFLAEAAGPQSWVVPSAGADFGKLIDQAAILKTRAFPTAMALPPGSPSTPDGAELALRRFADAYGKPIIVYIKSDAFLAPRNAANLVNSGCVAAIKYGTVRKDPADDSFLRELVQVVDRKYIISGIGERPAIVHLRDFGLAGFTSGCVCIAPRGSMALLHALKRHDYTAAENIRAAYLALEDRRDAYGPIPVLHEAVTLSGIANMGPILPMLSNIGPEHHPAVAQAARALLANDHALAKAA